MRGAAGAGIERVVHDVTEGERVHGQGAQAPHLLAAT